MQQTSIPYILSILTFLPVLGAIILMFLPRPQDLPEHHGAHGDEAHGEPDQTTGHPQPFDPARGLVNGVAILFAALNFLLSLALFGAYDYQHANPALRNMQFMENFRWISVAGINIHYRMGVDGISLLLIVLTTFLMLLSVLYSFGIKQRVKEFMVFLLLLEAGMIGVFCALDLVLFYVFWEAMLIPMYFLIGIFGHENRVYAAIKFFLYTFAGSVFMLVAIVAVYQTSGTFDIVALSDPTSAAGMKLHGLNPQTLMWMFGAFALAFMIKVPMFPFHTWLPDAHVEAPTAGSVILAGVMLKMGTYGLIRICLPLFSIQAQVAAPLFITLSIIGIIYASIVAAVQPDAKKLVAYSSVAHLGFVVLGIFTFTRIGMMGALIQNINHGISTPMLFFIVGMLYDRRHTREISEFGGLKKVVPMLATMLLLATFASIAVPFFNGFVGEFPILLGSWISIKTGYFPTALAATGMILSAVYMLWWFQRLMLGPITRPVNRHLPDLTRNEWLVLTPLAIMVFWIGLGSGFWTSRMDTAVNTLIPASDQKVDGDLPIGQPSQVIKTLRNEATDGNTGRPLRRRPFSTHTDIAPIPGSPPPQPEGTGGAPGTPANGGNTLSSPAGAQPAGSTNGKPEATTPSGAATPPGSAPAQDTPKPAGTNMDRGATGAPITSPTTKPGSPGATTTTAGDVNGSATAPANPGSTQPTPSHGKKPGP